MPSSHHKTFFIKASSEFWAIFKRLNTFFCLLFLIRIFDYLLMRLLFVDTIWVKVTNFISKPLKISIEIIGIFLLQKVQKDFRFRNVCVWPLFPFSFTLWFLIIFLILPLTVILGGIKACKTYNHAGQYNFISLFV